MSKYTRAHYQAAFEAAEHAYVSKDTSSAVSLLSETHGIQKGTAHAFVGCYRRMRQGIAYKRGLSEGATDVFLKGIKKLHGDDGLTTALQAADAHLVYRESLGHNLPGLQTLIRSFSRHAAAPDTSN